MKRGYKYICPLSFPLSSDPSLHVALSVSNIYLEVFVESVDSPEAEITELDYTNKLEKINQNKDIDIDLLNKCHEEILKTIKDELVEYPSSIKFKLSDYSYSKNYLAEYIASLIRIYHDAAQKKNNIDILINAVTPLLSTQQQVLSTVISSLKGGFQHAIVSSSQDIIDKRWPFPQEWQLLQLKSTVTKTVNDANALTMFGMLLMSFDIDRSFRAFNSLNAEVRNILPDEFYDQHLLEEHIAGGLYIEELKGCIFISTQTNATEIFIDLMDKQNIPVEILKVSRGTFRK